MTTTDEAAYRQRTAPRVFHRYVRLALGSLQLVLPQRDVHILEPSSDIEALSDCDGPIGWIAVDHGRAPVFCLSDRLERMHPAPPEWRICALLQHAGSLFGMLCGSVDILNSGQFRLIELPPCMHAPGAPIHGLALVGDNVMSVSSAGALAAHLGDQLSGSAAPLDAGPSNLALDTAL
jgi:hypothetical protein